ncbi:unnamed protein product [Phytophthora fragariaefolia]|uniref:Unnamed protein product n=1 Tax=Phytophthora fragariaefolia TaxID=1490495 RepID=A0A9W6YMZ6_9STRA|nr:unnamed protein product [Phytophthora fragariaefolia]
MTKTRTTNSPTNDDDQERVSAPIFAPTLPPRLSSTSHTSLAKWHRERREYEETIHSRAKGNTNDLIVSIKNTVDDGLAKNNDAPDIDAKDIHDRVIQYFKRCHDIINDQDWSQFFTGSDGRPQHCCIRIASLQTKALLDEITRGCSFPGAQSERR